MCSSIHSLWHSRAIIKSNIYNWKVLSSSSRFFSTAALFRDVQVFAWRPWWCWSENARKKSKKTRKTSADKNERIGRQRVGSVMSWSCSQEAKSKCEALLCTRLWFTRISILVLDGMRWSRKKTDYALDLVILTALTSTMKYLISIASSQLLLKRLDFHLQCNLYSTRSATFFYRCFVIITNHCFSSSYQIFCYLWNAE